MSSALVALYVVAPTVVFVSWFIDLWAKSYDLPRAQRIAKAALAGLVAVAFASAALLASRALDTAGRPGELWAVALAVALPIALLLWLVRSLDWRSAYAGAALGPPVMLLAYPGPNDSAQALMAGIMTAVVGVVAVRSEVYSVRFRRYARMLQRDCSCCGFKQRAVRELYTMGAPGEETIVRFLNGPGSRYETRVRDEWESCRPTTR